MGVVRQKLPACAHKAACTVGNPNLYVRCISCPAFDIAIQDPQSFTFRYRTTPMSEEDAQACDIPDFLLRKKVA